MRVLIAAMALTVIAGAEQKKPQSMDQHPPSQTNPVEAQRRQPVAGDKVEKLRREYAKKAGQAK
jgi:hypothetical protein